MVRFIALCVCILNKKTKTKNSLSMKNHLNVFAATTLDVSTFIAIHYYATYNIYTKILRFARKSFSVHRKPKKKQNKYK